MSRMRDISKFLARTAKANTDNVRVKFDGEPRTTRLVTSAVTNTIINDITAKYELTQDSLATSGLVAGDMTLVESAYDGARLYLSNGSGWYNVALVNTTPSFSFDSSLYTLDSENDSVLITFSDSDFDQTNLQDAVISFQPANITDSAINSSIVGNNITLTVRDSALGTYSFQVLGSISDGLAVGTDQATITLTLFTYSPDMQIVGSYASTRINVDSDVVGGAFQVASGDTLQDSTGAITATVSSAEFLHNTQQSRTNIGTLVSADAGDQGTGYFGINTDGTFGSSHIGRVVSLGNNNSTAASRFRSGNASGGQIISSYTTQTYSSTSTSTYSSGNSAFSNNWAFFGFIPNDYDRGGMLYNSNGWSSTLGTALPTNVALTTNSNGSSAVTNSNAAITTYQGRATKTHNPSQRSSGFWTYRSVSITHWSGRYNYMEYLNQSNTTYFKCTGNQTSYFTAGALLFSASSFPTERQITECEHLVVHSSSYASGANETTVYCGNQYNRQIRTLVNTGLTNTTFSTGSVSPAVSIQFWKSTNPQPVHYYQHTSTTNNSGMDIEYGDTVASNYISGVETLQLYQVTTSNVSYYKVATTPSPAGDGTNIALGTGNAGSAMYSWKNETSIVVDDNTGLTTTGKFLKYTDV